MSGPLSRLQHLRREKGQAMPIRLLNVIIATLLALGGIAFSQAGGPSATDVVLVLDASGSMFNRLADGRYRITAAKEALSAFISRLPESAGLNVGLRVYGSRTQALQEGACLDSVLTVPVAGLERELLQRSVQETQARGATPIAYSLTLAAEDLQQASGRKLIVLVTDGEESCGGDVRSVAAGLGIELRIIGFDLSSQAAASFDGIGHFENATSAAELAEALGRAIDLVPATDTHRVLVQLLRDGQTAADGGVVRFLDALSGETYHFAADAGRAGGFVADLPAGSYRAEVNDAFGEPLGFSGLSVAAEAENAFEFELAQAFELRLSVDPLDPVVGSEVSIAYEGGQEGGQGWITVVPLDAPDELFLDWAPAPGSSGEVQVRVPPEEGELEARYHLQLPEGGSRVIGRSEAFVGRVVEAGLEAADSVPGGSTFEVGWVGPDNRGDFVTIVAPGAEDWAFLSYFYTAAGSPGTLTAPLDAGDYELRYVSGGGDGVLARRNLSVNEISVWVSAPERVGGGQRFDVRWQGPEGAGDYLTVVAEGAPESSYLDYVYTYAEQPGTLVAPVDAGRYEVRYVSGQDGRTLASVALEVTRVEVSLSAPATVTTGQSFAVSWQGPDAPGDYLTIVAVGEPEGSYLSYAYTSNGSTSTLTAPDQPGQYEVRYVLGSDSRTMASVAVEVR